MERTILRHAAYTILLLLALSIYFIFGTGGEIGQSFLMGFSQALIDMKVVIITLLGIVAFWILKDKIE